MPEEAPGFQTKWVKPKPFRCDYTQFGKMDAAGPADETIEMLIVKHNAASNGFNLWTLNGEAFSMETMRPLYTAIGLSSVTPATISTHSTFIATVSSS
jgi:hypothetical protein